jgi:hypothetical protein
MSGADESDGYDTMAQKWRKDNTTTHSCIIDTCGRCMGRTFSARRLRAALGALPS